MKKRNLTYKFTLIFAAYTFFTLIISSLFSLIDQNKVYKQQREESVQFVASYLEELLIADDIYFVWYQKYFLENSDRLLVPYNFDTAMLQDARHEYEEALSSEYPGLVLGTDIDFDDLSDTTKKAYEIYSHEYYLAAFEKAQQMFNLSYIYYMVPLNDGTDDMKIVLDSTRKDVLFQGKQYIELGAKKTYPKSNYKHLWDAWETGLRPKGYDLFDNITEKTYAYYTPLYINGEKLGIIDVEVDVSAIIHEIHKVTFRNMLVVGSVLINFSIILLLVIRSKYIKKLVRLRNAIETYSLSKEPKIAEDLMSEITNDDEISVIISKFVDLIYELESYITNLSKTAMALSDTKQKALELKELAVKDSLTGVRNKTGYDKEIQKLEAQIEGGFTDFGVAMIDLNYLKLINDTYGHDKGNIAIIELCKIICSIFMHSPVFRVGGDEFVIILKDHDLNHIDELIQEFSLQMEKRQDDMNLENCEKT